MILIVINKDGKDVRTKLMFSVVSNTHQSLVKLIVKPANCTLILHPIYLII
jgi:hypothetical protein